MRARHAIFNFRAHNQAWPYSIWNAYYFATGSFSAESRNSRSHMAGLPTRYAVCATPLSVHTKFK
ncbi:hypothetical protein WS68_12790 [Burkholderia sp. TSV86]|nr:hypothetical protein WS68_12790 [Burkholderia sp. TSV86]